MAAILLSIKDQDRMVSSFYSVGRLSVKSGYWEQESSILTAGTREPFRIKIEITHPWGQPLVHILIEGEKLGVLSFPDKKFFIGDFTPESLSMFLGGRLDPRLVWAALRGYPNLPDYNASESRRANNVTLLNGGQVEMETLEVSPETLLPKAVTLSDRRTHLVFLDLQEQEGIRYAGEVRVVSPKGGRNANFKRERVVFNRSIPGQIFELPQPSGFEVIDLDKSEGPLP